MHSSKFEPQNKERTLLTQVKSKSDISVVFTKKKVWTSAAVSGIVVAKDKKNPYHEGGSQTMISVINELYNGEISPVETETPSDEKYRRTVNRVGQQIEEFEELLPPNKNIGNLIMLKESGDLIRAML